jgi:2-polyprenyl-3-methyl-5-hydroxy-6-metoxy-1,4-benzoquinol methylase
MKKTLTCAMFCLLLIVAGFSQPPEPQGFYQTLLHTNPKSLGKYWNEEIDIYNIKNGMRLLDIGGSDGKLILPLTLICDTLDYYLEDIIPDYLFYAPKFMALAQKNINPHAKFSVHQILGGDSTIPATGTFDRIIVRETFHHFEYPVQMLRELKRFMSQNGLLIISEPAEQKKFKYCKLDEPQKLIEMVESSGFKLVSSEKTNNGFIVYVFAL